MTDAPASTAKYDSETGLCSGTIFLINAEEEVRTLHKAIPLGKVAVSKANGWVFLSVASDQAFSVDNDGAHPIFAVLVKRAECVAAFADAGDNTVMSGTGAGKAKGVTQAYHAASAEGEGFAIVRARLSPGAKLTAQWTIDVSD